MWSIDSVWRWQAQQPFALDPQSRIEECPYLEKKNRFKTIKAPSTGAVRPLTPVGVTLSLVGLISHNHPRTATFDK